MTTPNQMAEAEAKLIPCPFCGGGQTEIRENGKIWGGMKYSEPTSVSVFHHCAVPSGQPHRAIERVGRDLESAIDAWNMRAAHDAQPSAELTDAQLDALMPGAAYCVDAGSGGSIPGYSTAQVRANYPQERDAGLLIPLYAHPAPQPQQADHDVRRILIDVVPGEDGMGEEVYAKSVEDVQNLLTRMGQQIEDLVSRPTATPPQPTAPAPCTLTAENKVNIKLFEALKALSDRCIEVKAELDAELPAGASVSRASGRLTWPLSTAGLALDEASKVLSTAPAPQAQAVNEGRTNRGDETGGTVKRFGWEHQPSI